jgi:YbbR domain-containing protein
MKRLGAGLRIFSGYLGNLLLALILALLVWIVAERQANPDIERTFSAAIPIELHDLPAGTIAYDASARNARVTLSAPQGVWDVLTADQLSAFIDLSGQLSGTLELPVQASIDNRMARITKVEPSVISLKLEPQIDVQLPVSIDVSGEPALGFAARPLETIPATVTVHGPASLVQQVAAVQGQLSIQDARNSITQTVFLSVRDRDRQSVPQVTLTPSTTLAVIRLQPLGGFRDLAVKIDLQGTLAAGYLISNVSVEPQVVTVFGSSAVLDALPGFIATEPVSVTNATQDINSRVRLGLPSGVSFLGDPTVQVNVTIKPIESSVTVLSPLIPQGLSPDLSARFSPEAIDVILSGPIARLNALQSGDVQSFAHLFNLITGTYQITPTVVVPAGMNVVSVLPSTVQVTIGPYITPTLTITATSASPLPSPTPSKQ